MSIVNDEKEAPSFSQVQLILPTQTMLANPTMNLADVLLAAQLSPAPVVQDSPSVPPVPLPQTGVQIQQGKLISPNYATGISGWSIDSDGFAEFNSGTFRGALTASTIDIGGSDASSFHVDIDGNMWMGAATFNISTNPFAVSNAGVLRAVSGVVGPWNLSSTAISTGAFDTLNTMYFGTSGLSLSNKFKVTAAGAMTATSGTIAIWSIDANALSTGAFDTNGTMYFGTSGLSISNTFKVTSAGALSATSGTIGGFTLGASSMYGGIIKTASTVGLGSTGVIMDTAGLRGYDSVLGLVFNLPTNGDAPTFSKGVISGTTFEINTNAVLRTSSTVGDGSGSSAGVLINNTGIYGVGANQTLSTANIRIGVDGSGYFSGVFNIGGTQITIDTGDSIQDALDDVDASGGGTVYLQTGTYTLSANVDIPSGVQLQGVSRDGVIIDGNGSYGLRIMGANAYSTGTVTISTGGTTVVGSGTTWTAGMVGRSILLGGIWYEILARTDNTHITISTYTGPDLSGASYTIADPNFTARIKDVTVTNTSGSGVKVQYAMEPLLDNLFVYDCGTGIETDQSVYAIIRVTSIENGVNLDMNDSHGWYVDFSDLSGSTTGAGCVMTNNTYATFFNTITSGCFGNGLSMTTCNNITFISVAWNSNGGHGVEMISGNSDNQFMGSGCDSNTGDGIKLTATTDRTSFSSVGLTNNGGYGINIAASTCDNNQVISPAFNNNASGNINDLGTNTVILPQTNSFTAEQDLTVGMLVGISFDLSSKVSRAFAPYFDTTTADTNSGSQGSVIELSGADDKFVYIYPTAGTTLKAVVGTINRSTRAISFGTAVTISTNVQSTGNNGFLAVPLSTNKFAVVFGGNADKTLARVVACTVSGSTITVGTEATIFDHATANVITFGVAQLGTDKMITGMECNNGDVRAVCTTFSGTTPTSGTAANLNASIYNAGQGMCAVKINTDKFVIWGANFAQCGTVSGTTITLGTAVNVTLDFTLTQVPHMVSHDTDKFIVKQASDLMICTVSGTTITTNSIQSFTGSGVIRVVSTTELRMYASTTIAKFTISGATATETIIERGIGFSPSPNELRNPIISTSNGYWAIFGLASTTSLRASVEGMSNSFIGIAQATVSRGGSVDVKTSGIDGNQSGLVPGATYNISTAVPGALQVAASSGLDTPRELTLFRALSSTSLLIK